MLHLDRLLVTLYLLDLLSLSSFAYLVVLFILLLQISFLDFDPTHIFTLVYRKFEGKTHQCPSHKFTQTLSFLLITQSVSRIYLMQLII